ncbi:MAG TPA: hypothetical protein VE826_08580 [Dongiaceae bacterium]|nr:hypothetical protein [Dongiaceae bacterium]
MTATTEIRPNGAKAADLKADPAAVVPKTDPPVSWPDPLGDAPWPSPYRAFSDTCTEPEPRLPRRTIMALAPLVTQWFLEDDQSFARHYGVLASLFQNHDTKIDLCEAYRDVLRTRLKAPRRGNAKSTLLDAVNQHDLANIHRAVWLMIYRAMTCLLDINPHGDWGDPPAGGTSQGQERYQETKSFHTNPNGYGSFAISTLDFAPPDLGLGEKSPAATDQPIPGSSLSNDQIKATARALGRGLVDPWNGDNYLYVVKSYYRDRNNHTSVPGDAARSYSDVIAAILQQGSAGAPPAQTLTDQDFANVHRGAWLFLAHRFYFVVGKKAFGDLDDANLTMDKDGRTDVRAFEVPNPYKNFTVKLAHIDPDDDP